MKMIAFSFLAFAFLLPVDHAKTSFQEEVSTRLSRQHAFQKSTAYIMALPTVNKQGKNKLEGSESEGYTAGSKSFIVYKHNQFYRQPKAEIHYKVKIELEEGRYKYRFSDFKVYTYARNRYGVFTRSSSKAFQLEKLSSAKRKELKPLIATEVAKYITRLKNALAL